jgi:hypothetical protein
LVEKSGMPIRVKKLAAWRWDRIYSRRRKYPLILPEVVVTAGRKKTLEEVALVVVVCW